MGIRRLKKSSRPICYNFPYVLYLARIVLVRWDRLRQPPCGDDD